MLAITTLTPTCLLIGVQNRGSSPKCGWLPGSQFTEDGWQDIQSTKGDVTERKYLPTSLPYTVELYIYYLVVIRQHYGRAAQVNPLCKSWSSTQISTI